jgi:hypothetical protein
MSMRGTEIGQWLQEAEPGQELQYFEGFLAAGTDSSGGPLPESERCAVVRVADRLWLAAQHRWWISCSAAGVQRTGPTSRLLDPPAGAAARAAHLAWRRMMSKREIALDANGAAGTPTGRSPNAAEHALQRDMFTGEWQAKPPKRGSGSHVRLKEREGEKAILPGMASCPSSDNLRQI